jgi:Dot/Icm secretion system protein IcmQ
MREEDKETAQRYLDFLKKLDETVEEGSWDKSLFLTAVGKKLAKFRDQLQDALGLNEQEAESSKQTMVIAADGDTLRIPEGMIDIYVSVYCAKGNKTEAWASVLSTLTATIISRPIYRVETNARELVSSKSSKENDAYCLVYVKEADIVRPFTGQNPRDKLGHELVVLRRGAIQQQNIIQLVHTSGVYLWQDGKLIPKAAS